MKEKITYCEKYKKGAITVKQHLLPESLPFTTPGTVIKEIEMIDSGTLTRNEEEFDFCTVRVLMQNNT